jgi:hypothetical protein
MQVLILAVQNSIDYKYLGVATSGTMLFRAVGGALGVALFGAIFASGLHASLGPAGKDFLSGAIPTAGRGRLPFSADHPPSRVMVGGREPADLRNHVGLGNRAVAGDPAHEQLAAYLASLLKR